MNSIFLISVIVASSSLLVNGQTKTTYCPSGYYTGYVSTAYTNKLSPVTTLAGVNYGSGGFYQVTASSGADQCCYNCATQTGGTCTTWTYDGCGTCYLSSASGASNYLVSKGTTTTNTGCGYSRSCTPASGFITNGSGVTTTTAAATIPFPG